MFGRPQGMSFLPIFLVIWSSATFIVSYLIAICRNDVDVILPYISDTSTTPPESCIFGLMTFFSACAGTATIYTRFKFVEQLNRGTNVVRRRVNVAALALGLISCLGMVVVATFQETAVTIAHKAGAILFFVCGILYIILQTIISYKDYPIGSSITICRVRLGFVIITILACLPWFICVLFVTNTSLHRHRDDQDYLFHLASAVCEWIMAFSFIFFFFTYINEFKFFILSIGAELQE